MSDDPCDRARQAMGELCGADPVEDDGNTFYVQTVHTQGRRVEPRDTNQIAQAAEQAAREAEITLGLPSNESVDTQTISPSQGRMETYFKLPVDGMTPREADSVLDSIESAMSVDEITTGRGFDSVRLVDRSVVFDAVPEMVGPAREEDEVF